MRWLWLGGEWVLLRQKSALVQLGAQLSDSKKLWLLALFFPLGIVFHLGTMLFSRLLKTIFQLSVLIFEGSILILQVGDFWFAKLDLGVETFDGGFLGIEVRVQWIGLGFDESLQLIHRLPKLGLPDSLQKFGKSRDLGPTWKNSLSLNKQFHAKTYLSVQPWPFMQKNEA